MGQSGRRWHSRHWATAADVYARSPHTGRGGWSWYTGPAGWMYRLILESLLGLELEVDKLHVAPCIPADWPGCRGHYRYRGTVYRIVVSQTHRDDDEQPSRMRVTVDGVLQTVQAIPLLDDRQEHAVEVGIDAVPG